jgi:putative DNA primase/helicase
MKSAPNLKHLPKEKFTEAVIFAGSDAYAHAKGWEEGLGKEIAEDTTPPIYLGPKQLAELDNLHIVDKGRRSARVYIAGDIEPILINAIGEKLAQAGVQDARLYKGIPDRNPEDWRDYLNRVREQFNAEESNIHQLPVTKRAPKTETGDELKPRVESRDDGVFWVTPKVDKETGEIINPETWLCSPIEVVGSGSDGAERYLVLRWRSPRGHEDITRAIPCADIGERDGWRSLKAGGVNVTTKNTFRAILADWLQQSGTGQEWRISHTSGWHYGAYVMPDGEVIGEPETPILFNGRSAAAGGYDVSGTAESWRNSVARLACGNPSMMLGVAASMAAPLIGLVGADGFGVHLFEQSSAGKTTTANIASSVWGVPDALRLTWYGTALGIANEAEAHNDGLLPLDEIGQGSNARDVATSAYTLFNGAGKLQGAKEGGNRELKRWRTVAVSTGEMDIETFLSAGGLRVKAGQLVRLLNIPMEKATVFNGQPNGKAHADALKEAWLDNHGAAGREWVKWLAAHQQEAKQAVRDAQERWRGLIPSDYGEQVHRVAERFAILDAALVLSCHITGWSEQASRDAIQHSFNAWVKEFGTGNKEHQQIIEQCEAFLNTYGFSRYLPYPESDARDLPIKELAGYRTGSQSSDEVFKFYTFPAAFEQEIARGFNHTQFARALASAGMLETGDKGRYKKKALRKMGGKQHVFYVLMFSPDDE